MSESELELYEALARMRDHHYAIGEVLDKLVQTKAKVATKDYDVESLNWVQREGAKGPYEFCDPKTEGTKTDFKALLADLKAHDGKFRHKGMFYWVFNDAASIGRKQLKK